MSAAAMTKTTLFVQKLKNSKQRTQTSSSYKYQRGHKKFSVFRENEILLLRMDISPRKSKFKNFKLILNSVDLTNLFEFKTYLKLIYNQPMTEGLILKIQRCNPKIHFLNFCHYIARRIYYEVKSTSYFPRIVINYVPWKLLRQQYLQEKAKNQLGFNFVAKKDQPVLSFKNKFSNLSSKSSSILTSFLEVRDMSIKRLQHRVMKLNGKYVIQTVFREEKEKRFMVKNYVPKNCRVYTTSLDRKEFKPIFEKFILKLMKCLLWLNSSEILTEKFINLKSQKVVENNPEIRKKESLSLV